MTINKISMSFPPHIKLSGRRTPGEAKFLYPPLLIKADMKLRLRNLWGSPEPRLSKRQQIHFATYVFTDSGLFKVLLCLIWREKTEDKNRNRSEATALSRKGLRNWPQIDDLKIGKERVGLKNLEGYGLSLAACYCPRDQVSAVLCLIWVLSLIANRAFFSRKQRSTATTGTSGVKCIAQMVYN